MTDAPDTADRPAIDNNDFQESETGIKVEETDWKAEARKWETRAKDNARTAKENAAAAQRLAEFEESQKTEAQRLLERAEAAEKRVAAFESERQVAAWKTEVADKAGVPARLLRGSTLEELTAHAEELREELGASKRGPFVPGPGNIPDTPTNNDAAWFGAVLRGSK